MWPLILDGAVIKVQRKRIYWPGEIITFQTKWGELATHRLIGMYPWNGTTRYLTQADNTIWPEGSITDKQILGKVVGGDCSAEAVNIPLKHRLRAIGYFIRFLAFRLFNLKKNNWVQDAASASKSHRLPDLPTT